MSTSPSVRILAHIVLATENRTPWLANGVKTSLNFFVSNVLQDQGAHPVIIRAAANHLHVLCYLSETVSPARTIEAVKAKSSQWLRRRGGNFKDFDWEKKHEAFSVGEEQLEEVRAYIMDQEEHHENLSFQEEEMFLLRRHAV